jgi:hypothetical protein
MKQKITIKLSDSACAVLKEMSRRAGVKPKAIARVAIEYTLAQAVDDMISDDGDSWLIESAVHPGAMCRKSWNDVEAPGNYRRHITV